MRILIAPTVGEVYSSSFTTTQNNNATMICNGLQGSENVTVQIYDIVINEFKDWIIAGKPQQMNAQNNVIEIYISQGTFRVHKTATSNPIGVAISQVI